MKERLEWLITHVTSMYRMKYIDVNAYIEIVGELKAILEVYKASDVSAALALYEAVKAVINV